MTESWYVAYTRVNFERKAAQAIAKLGHATYVATQREWRQWSDRRKLMDRVVITQIVFIKCSLKATEQLERLSFISHFLRIPGTRVKATIPGSQLSQLRMALENSESAVLFTSDKFGKGDPVTVRFGKLAGLTGTVERTADGSDCLIIRLDYLGSAKVKIRAEELMPAGK